jgi:hypothetical protein
MSQAHKVIILNKPLKVFDFTIIQLVLMFFSVLGSFFAATQVPKDWKFNGMPGGALVFILLVCLMLALVKMSEVKTWSWWLNLLLYRLNAVPTTFLPKPEPAPIYPDPTIIDEKKESHKNYVEAN